MRLDVKNGQLWHGDCLEVMQSIPAGSVDMILCDLPYGTTACSWDSVIPFEPLWREYWRIAKPNAAIVLTAAQPFTSALIMSQIDWFKYVWVWEKESGTGFGNANRQPLRNVEDICVFGRGQQNYNPQFESGKPYKTISKGGNHSGSVYQNGGLNSITTENDGKRFPKQLIKFSRDKPKIHPTQKPVALFEYLIRTYTNEGDTVMDNCMGSGTTTIAAENTGRRWIGIERDLTYYLKAWERIMSHGSTR